jgi:amino-acid N-acetyltransferase
MDKEGWKLMPDEMKLRSAKEEDIPVVQQLLKENDLPIEDIPMKIGCLVMAHKGAQFLGVGGIERYGELGLLRSIVINNPFRGKGYGRTLCDLLIDQAKSRGIRELYLLTMTSESFFKHLGFRRIDRKIVPKVLQETSEFKELCPVSSVCMKMNLA